MEYTDIELKNEQWRDIDGYDGMYQVSDLGRVRSLKFGRVKVLRPNKSHKGYLQIMLYRYGKGKNLYVHRLVANAFIPNSDESKTQINHINECKSDNRFWNLEYCTASYNLSYNGLRYRRHHPQPKRTKIKELYNPNLTYRQNLEIFKANGVECGEDTLLKLRRELGLIESQPVRSKIKKLYDKNLTYAQNLEIFKANGIDCHYNTVLKLRKELGLINQRQRPKDAL